MELNRDVLAMIRGARVAVNRQRCIDEINEKCARSIIANPRRYLARCVETCQPVPGTWIDFSRHYEELVGGSIEINITAQLELLAKRVEVRVFLESEVKLLCDLFAAELTLLREIYELATAVLYDFFLLQIEQSESSGLMPTPTLVPALRQYANLQRTRECNGRVGRPKAGEPGTPLDLIRDRGNKDISGPARSIIFSLTREKNQARARSPSASSRSSVKLPAETSFSRVCQWARPSTRASSTYRPQLNASWASIASRGRD